MNRNRLTQFNTGYRFIYLGITFSLATLFTWAMLSFGSTHASPQLWAAPTIKEISTINSNAVITIGVGAGLTGMVPEAGQQQVNAVMLAVDEVNAAGGVNIGGASYSVTIAVADSGCNATQAIAAANELLSAGASVIVGHTCSSASMAAAPIYNAAQVPMISPSSQNPFLTQQGLTNTFRTTPHNGSTARQLATYFHTVDKTRTAIIINPSGWAPELAANYQAQYESLGGTIVSSYTITNVATITPTLMAIANQNVDVILTADLLGFGAGLVSRIAYELGLPHTMGWVGVGWYGVLNDSYISEFAGQDAAEGDFVAIEGKRVSDMPGYAAFEEAYLAANFLQEPIPHPPTAVSYDTTNIILAAIEQAGTTNTLAIRQAIADTHNFMGVLGIYQGFDPNGDLIAQWGEVLFVQDSNWTTAQGQAQYYNGQAGILDLAHSFAQKTTIAIPARTTSETLAITYTLIATIANTSAANLTMIGDHVARIEPNMAISVPMTMTIEFEPDQLVNVDELTIALYTWNGSQWVSADPCGGYIRDPVNHMLEIIICHFSEYVLFGEVQIKTYLPVILKTPP